MTVSRIDPDRGYLWERTLVNRTERVFLDIWNETFRHDDDLAMLLGERSPSRRDRYVLATFCQWLGTNCGYAFLSRGLNACGAYLQWKSVSHSDPLLLEMLEVHNAQSAAQMQFDLSEPI